MIECIVFDFDGTLVDSNDIKRNTFFDVVVDFPESQSIMNCILASKYAGDRYQIFQRFADEFAAIARELPPNISTNWADLATDLANKYTRICRQKIAVCPEILGMTETLKMLQNKELSMYINSATPQKDLIEIVKERQLERFFKGILGCPASKIDNLKTILEWEKCQPDSLLVVGDGESDRYAAVSLQCCFVGISCSSTQFPQSILYQISDLHSLHSVIKTINRKPSNRQ